MTKKYEAKISYGLLTFIFLVCYVPLFFLWMGEGFYGKMIGGIVVITLTFAFILHLFLKTQYTIENKKLKIKCGVFSYPSIYIEKIKEISNTKSIFSAPAPSFDRIEIEYGKFNKTIISPKDKLNFANDLTKMNPDIKNNVSE